MSHPAFVRVVSKGITGTEREVKVSPRELLERQLLSLGESVVVLFGIPLLVLLGVLATLVYMAAAIGLALLAIATLMLLDGWTLWIAGPPWQELLEIGGFLFAVVMIGAFLVGPVVIGRRRAQIRRDRHRFGEPPVIVASAGWIPSAGVAGTVVTACAVGSIVLPRVLGLHSVWSLFYVTVGTILLTLFVLAVGPTIWQERRALSQALRTPPARPST
jgi:hypothetical protein